MNRNRMIGGVICLVVAAAMFLYPGTREHVTPPIVLVILGVTLIAISRRR